MALRFGIFDHVTARADVDLAQQYEERLRLLEQADASGFHAYHVAEHHHSPLSLVPNQAVYLAAVAQRTRRLRLGSLVSVLPLHHPVRLIEELCMLDNLSDGRLEIGVGRGTTRGAELEMWGGDPAENDRRFEETFRILFRGLTHEYLSFEGEFYRFANLWMAIRPRQRPHPPFWYAGNAKHAAAWGMNFVGAGPTKRLAATFEEYRRELAGQCRSADPDLPHHSEPLFGAMKHLYVAANDREAEATARRAYRASQGKAVKPVPAGATRTPLAEEEAHHNPGLASFDDLIRAEALLVGSPATVRELLARYERESGANYAVVYLQWGDLTHAEAVESTRLFADAVMPDFTRAPALS